MEGVVDETHNVDDGTQCGVCEIHKMMDGVVCRRKGVDAIQVVRKFKGRKFMCK